MDISSPAPCKGCVALQLQIEQWRQAYDNLYKMYQSLQNQQNPQLLQMPGTQVGGIASGVGTTLGTTITLTGAAGNAPALWIKN